MRRIVSFVTFFLLSAIVHPQDNWSIINIPKPYPQNFLINGTGVYFLYCQGAGMYRSRDKGTNWEEINNFLTDQHITCFAIRNNEIFLGTWTTIFRTTNEGDKWEDLKCFPNYMNSHKGIYYTHDGNIYSQISNGFIYSTDNGVNWQKRINSIGSNYCFLEDKTGVFFVGSSQGIHKSMDNGLTWEKVATYMVNNIQNNSKNVIFTSNSKMVYKSTNQGNTWQDVSYNLSLNSSSIDLLKIINDDVYIFHNKGINILKNNSTNWSSYGVLGLQKDLFGEYFFDDLLFYNNYFYIVQNNKLYKSTEIITFIEECNSIPYYYELFQNYPNPFNPSTKIKYSLPQISSVTLKVYDILGREITTLVNEEKLRGNYEVKFDGSNLASGVYFYRLQAGSFSETKKFIVLK